ncbi:MAG: hypothetical protein EPN20_08035 [Magnetospirillum sp.]|nr:MAG: hypothetical protein EPN20_08035 [Magnetospirillum sp.]
MTVPRRYSVAEVEFFVDLFRATPEHLTADQISGMDYLVKVLKHYEHMTEADIEAEVRVNWNRV